MDSRLAKLGASTEFGSGLVDPNKAIMSAADFISSALTAVPPPAPRDVASVFSE